MKPKIFDMNENMLDLSAQPTVLSFQKACNLRTHLSFPDKGLRSEFGAIPFNYTPIELLHFLSLRKKLGLPSFNTEHPLLPSTLDPLNEITLSQPQPSSLIGSIMLRLANDGYSDNAIYYMLNIS